MKFNTAEQVVENFILWYTSDEKEREQLISTINDPMITYLNYEDIDLGDDNSRLEDNIRNVMTWIDRQGFHGKELLRLLGCVVQYFTEDHVDGLESFGNYDVDADAEECVEAFKKLKIYQIDSIDHPKYHILEKLSGDLKENPTPEKVKAFRATYNYLSAKQECLIAEAPINLSDYTIPTDKLIPFLDIPLCFKIEDKVFLAGDQDASFIKVETDDSWDMVELFDMTTEMETGHSYSFYVSSTGYFKGASLEEAKKVAEFLESIK